MSAEFTLEMREGWMNKARDYWRSKRSSMTAVREIICDTCFDQKGAFDAEALHDDCRKKDGLISLATVYRTLRSLVEAELLWEVEGIDNKRRFVVRLGDQIGEGTIHCTDCNKVFPLNDPCMALRESATARKHGFTPNRVSLRVESTCDSLRKEGKCEKHG